MGRGRGVPKGTELDPRFLEVLADLANTYDCMGRYAESDAAYRRALAPAPDFRRGLDGRVSMFVADGHDRHAACGPRAAAR